MSSAGSLRRSALRDANVPGDADTFWTAKIGPGTRIVEAYIDYSARVPVNRKVVFYETMSGARVGDNPFAIFEYLRSHPRYGTYLHVWSLDAAATVPEKYAQADDVVFVRRNTQAYAYFLAVAGWVIGNANLPLFFTRRSEQKYLNTWHGVPYKALGRDTPGAKFGPPDGTGSFLKATHVLSQCRFMSEAVLSAYSMVGTSTAVIAETGYPRVDFTVTPDPHRTMQIREILDIGQVQGRAVKPVVLYAPTWRAESGQDVVDTEQLLTDLKAIAALDVHLLYRGHHRMDRIIKDQIVADQAGQITIPPHDISSNELLAVVDILITDYSSIFFDFIPTGRPIVHYLYDLEEYRRTRGLNLELNELPGEVAQSTDELVRVVKEAADSIVSVDPSRDLRAEPLQGERYRSAQKRFCPREDGHSSMRAVEFFFRDAIKGVPTLAPRDERATVVYWAGAPESVPDADRFLKRVVRSGGSPRSQTTLMVERFAKLSKSTLQSIRALRGHISTISFNPAEPVLLPEEHAAYDAFLEKPSLSLKEARQLLRTDLVLRAVFLREYRRRLDDAQFDSVVLAPYLPNFEVALAVFAFKSEPLSLKVSREGLDLLPEPIRSVVSALLPPGSSRRERVWRTYRALAKRLR